MKKSALLLLLLIGAVGSYAQDKPVKVNVEKEQVSGSSNEVRLKFKGTADRKLILSIAQGHVKVEGYDGDDVVITAHGYEPPPKRAEGLKPLTNAGPDNSGIGLHLSSENNTHRLVKAARGDVDYTIKVPRKIDIIYEESNWHGGEDIEMSNVEGEIEVSAKNSEIRLTNVSGPVVANSISGDIIIVYSSLNASKPSSISAVSGFVDISLPANAKANIKLKTISGEIYSNVDIATKNNKENMAHIGGNSVEGTLNGGGAEINLSAISGDIYLRKGKQ